jgi:nucleoside-diphosphate-sugar epimerase
MGGGSGIALRKASASARMYSLPDSTRDPGWRVHSLERHHRTRMAKSVLIIGANGRLGQVLTAAFLKAGWQVHGQVRRQPPRPQPGVHWVNAPSADAKALAETVRVANVVVHAANPIYTRWQTQAQPLAQFAADTARRLSALLMFPGNVYNFGRRMPQLLVEDVEQRPTTRKGRIRVELEKSLREAGNLGLRTVVIRAGDFFGGPGRGSWFDLIIAKSLRKGRVVYPGPLHVVHAWAYLPDLARAFVMVAERHAVLPMFEVLHFPGHALTGTQLLECIARAARRQGLLLPNVPLQRRSLPWPLLRVAGLAVPMLREISEMRYLWYAPHRLAGERMTKLIGEVPVTSIDQAMDDTLRELFAGR